MKIFALFLSIALYFLPLALTLSSSSFSSNHLLLPSQLSSSNATILDTDKNPIKVGVKYYVLSAKRGKRGGLTLSKVVSRVVCTQDIIQETNELNNGLAVEFFPAYPNKTGELILSNNPINVKFHFSSNEISPNCTNFTVWKLDEKYRYVVGRGILGDLKNIENWFRIFPRRYGNGYIL
ncbi:putative dolichyl-diphosphooligosaccharide--protein glycosyltransferase subunit 2-like [Capsicum annuum]|uniref:Miraculin-like n=1 Tax=Capsicum annuum TaxID=4072 RepID=A0A2G2YJB2_CAPAN|nr:sporamin B-like [Capsicum annuum]KAF3633091.1 putative dolichyl-diphosphooligosaccharide--protein glycosyltransferase subunit 2-like [Capsicum annuum]KAF3633205.1 putative dolichyl-diphosphooligosaccharide--protein glycosyltransferase subunit 2-like [Capsicum annuum]PHT69833.1 hypothetical protein T459_24937 [Capsicum annuum]